MNTTQAIEQFKLSPKEDRYAVISYSGLDATTEYFSDINEVSRYYDSVARLYASAIVRDACFNALKGNLFIVVLENDLKGGYDVIKTMEFQIK